MFTVTVDRFDAYRAMIREYVSWRANMRERYGDGWENKLIVIDPEDKNRQREFNACFSFGNKILGLREEEINLIWDPFGVKRPGI